MEWYSSILGHCPKHRSVTGLLSIALLQVFVSACTDQLALERRSTESASAAAIADSLVQAVDQNGNPTAVKGFSENKDLKSGETIDAKAAPSEDAIKQPIFKFEEPKGYSSEFSEPIMVTSSFLTADPGLDNCSAKSYQSKEPTLDDVFRFSKTQSICGPVEMTFCIRLTAIGLRQDAAYLKTPPIKINLLCPAESFAGAGFEIDQSTLATAATSVDLKLKSTKYTTEMYVTNTPGCQSGGSWQKAVDEKKAWSVVPDNGKAVVYVAYRDFMGHESVCFSTTATVGGPAPTPTPGPTTSSVKDAQLSINAGSLYTNSRDVALSIAASSATSMYLTSTAGCTANGSWAPFATSASWTLNEENAEAKVYVKFKDANSLESSCVHASIMHDNQAPSAASLSIDAGAASTTSTSVNLTLAASGATEMYITNSAACAAGGSWVSYATTSAWNLAQSLSLATVYAKFRDAARNESACVSDQITHQAIGPSATSISINSAASYTNTANVTLTLGATNASDMYITNTAGCTTGGSWLSYATSAGWTLGQAEALATVYVKFRDALGNESACINDTITHDSVAPSITSISINTAAPYATSTSVTLALAATDASEVYVTNTAGCSGGGSWSASATSLPWTLGQTNSTATVYVKFKDAAGNESSCINDTIIHDSLAPSATSISINAAAPYATSTSVTLTLAATDASEMYVTNTAGCSADGSWQANATSLPWTLGQTNATATVYVKFRDTAGNESSCVNDTITHDSQAPTSTSISINAAATHTNSTSATLTLAATDASDMYITNTATCSAGGSWTTYATGPAWTLGQTNATATVYVKFRDTAGNESACINDTIVHDDVAPTSTSISISAGAAASASSSVTLGLAATGAGEMYITNTASCSADGSWEAYAVSKASWGLGQTNATATVYAKFRDTAGNESACTSDTIVHDNQAPSAPTNFYDGTSTTSTTRSPTLSWTASTDSGSGIAAYEVAIGSTSGGTELLAWTNVGNVTAATATGLSLAAATTYYASVRALDAAGNPSSQANGDGFTLRPWKQEAYIKAANARGGDEFGNTVSLSGDTLATGVAYETSSETTITNGTTASTNTSSTGRGAAYIYKRSGATWEQESYIKAVNGASDDRFGISISLSGDTVAVGAHWEDANDTTISNGTTASTNNSATSAGAVYVYARSGTVWAQQAYIKASNAEASDTFGASGGVSLVGDTLAVGSAGEDSNQTTITNGGSASTDNSNSGSGAVYVYRRTGVNWAEEAYIKAVNGEASDAFGIPVSLGTDTLAVGAQSEDSNQTTITNGTGASTDNTNSASGAVYLYARSAAAWAQEAYIKASNNDASDSFGRALSLNGNTLAVASTNESSSQTTITNGTGSSTSNTLAASGAVYVYKRTAANWAQEAYIKAVNANANDSFGYSVSLVGDTLVVSATAEDSNQTTITNGPTASTVNTVTNSGAAYVYQRSAATWTQEAYIKAPNPDITDNFGRTVSLSGDTVAVGALYEDSQDTTITNGTTASTDNTRTDSGAIYIFSR